MSVLSLHDVEEQMTEVVKKHFHQGHFLTYLREGRYTYEQIRYFAIQYYHYSRNFPRVLGAAIAAMAPIDDWWIPLADNLWDEAGRGKPGRSHAELYKTFLFSVDPTIELNQSGLPINPPISQAVVDAIETFISFFQKATPLQAMAAVGFGSEFFAGEVMGAIGEGLSLPIYNVDRTLDITFWKVHSDEHEPHHYQLCKNVLEQFRSEQELEEMLRIGILIAKSEAKMYHQLHNEMMNLL
jgi:pyrroloquinoline-quinone synthase